jgi:ectoine hydroxylase-related dioxygenase (phytanoyl-CoA dioxygenase family)
LVPGSHRLGVPPPDAMPGPAAGHLGEVQLIAPAGTVVIFNSHLRHGGTRNRTGRPRRALHSYFTRRGNPQQLGQKKYIRPETLARLSPPARFILDV